MIEFQSVSKSYSNGPMVVRDFSLTIPAHSTVALLGSSGCGKTTLLRMINRMVDPTEGVVRIDGEDVQNKDPVQLRRSIGYVLQAGGLMPHRSVLHNIATVPRLNGVSKQAALSRAWELLEVVGLDANLAKRYPAELSGGQQQRVGVARALASDPNILLMDEPFGAVDPIIRRELQDELLRIQAELGKTIVFVTHDVDEAFRLGDQVVLLREGGKIAQQGTPSDLLSNPSSDFVANFIGADNNARKLRVRTVNGQKLAIDSEGRPIGVLDL
jgi:hypothetical protein